MFDVYDMCTERTFSLSFSFSAAAAACKHHSVPFIRLMHSHKLPLLVFNDAISFSSTTFLTYGCRVHVIHKLYAIVHVNANANGWFLPFFFFAILRNAQCTLHIYIFNFQLSFFAFSIKQISHCRLRIRDTMQCIALHCISLSYVFIIYSYMHFDGKKSTTD